jgi:antitoxin component of MazEF toxin-antitoxin module
MKCHLDKYGGRLALTLPNDVVRELGWGHGDVVDLTVAGNALMVTRSQTAHDHALEIARKVMNEYRSVFETLAKS